MIDQDILLLTIVPPTHGTGLSVWNNNSSACTSEGDKQALGRASDDPAPVCAHSRSDGHPAQPEGFGTNPWPGQRFALLRAFRYLSLSITPTRPS